LILSFISDGPKTVLMVEALQQGALNEYEIDKAHFRYLGLSYQILKSHFTVFSEQPLACIGANPLEREIILLDPTSSPYLEKRYQQFILQNNFSFESISQFIENVIFNPNWVFLSSVSANRLEFPVISLDTFVEAGVGVCRHFALVTAYFLDRLSKEEKIANGKSYYIRNTIETASGSGGHAWNLYLLEDRSAAWHIDTQWGIIKNILIDEDLHFLIDAYGKSAMESNLCLVKQT